MKEKIGYWEKRKEKIERFYDIMNKAIKKYRWLEGEKTPLNSQIIDYFALKVSGEGTVLSSFVELSKGENIRDNVEKIKAVYFLSGLACAKEFPEMLESILGVDEGFEFFHKRKEEELRSLKEQEEKEKRDLR